MKEPVSMKPSPHLRDPANHHKIMGVVCLVLLIPAAGGSLLFGARVWLLLAAGALSAVVFEGLYQKLMKKPRDWWDGSAAVTGMLVALSLPVTVPLWTVAAGTFFGIVIIKQIPGGLGKNPLNPAAAARVMLAFVFPDQVSRWVLPGTDAVSGATPLSLIQQVGMDTWEEAFTLPWLLLGWTGGGVGETSAVLIIGAALLLAWKKVIDLRISGTTLAAAAMTALVVGGFRPSMALAHVFSGALVFGAVFMVTDYTTSPLTLHGRMIFGAGVGVLTVLVRVFSPLDGGFGLALLGMNLLRKPIDQWATPRVMGARRQPVNQEVYELEV